jgi:hypothetical protein
MHHALLHSAGATRSLESLCSSIPTVGEASVSPTWSVAFVVVAALSTGFEPLSNADEEPQGGDHRHAVLVVA